jgi:SNF2 family DNA or RNA helicase
MELKGYQNNAVKLLKNNPRFGLFYDMGLGKTLITLTAIADLLSDLAVLKILIVAPLKVAETTWHSEAEKWAHTKHLTFSKILGCEKSRIAALEKSADIYVINRENLKWLYYRLLKNWDFDLVIFDEFSSFRNHSSERFKTAASGTRFTPRVWGLTGTPTPKGCVNLWAQIYILDRGERLGRTITEFRRNFCIVEKTIPGVATTYKIDPLKVDILLKKISDITSSLRAEDCIELPQINYNYIEVELSKKGKKAYDELAREHILPLIEGSKITALSAAALSTKLIQLSGGAIYVGDANENPRRYAEIHEDKLDALEELVEKLDGKPVLIAYIFKHELVRILKRLKKYNPKVFKNEEDYKDWNEGKISVMLVHPASAGHGLNFQFGGSHAIWFGLTYDLEIYEQFNKRLHRTGQKNKVFIHHIIGKNTKDPIILKVLQKKATLQASVMQELQNYE